MDPEASLPHAVLRAPHGHRVGTRTNTKRKQTTREVLEAPHCAETNITPHPEDKTTPAHQPKPTPPFNSALVVFQIKAERQHEGNGKATPKKHSATTNRDTPGVPHHPIRKRAIKQCLVCMGTSIEASDGSIEDVEEEITQRPSSLVINFLHASHHGQPRGWEPPNYVYTQHVVSVPPGHSHRASTSRVVQVIDCEAH